VYLLREKIFVEKTSILFGCILILFLFFFFFLLGEQLPKNVPFGAFCLDCGIFWLGRANKCIHLANRMVTM